MWGSQKPCDASEDKGSRLSRRVAAHALFPCPPTCRYELRIERLAEQLETAQHERRLAEVEHQRAFRLAQADLQRTREEASAAAEAHRAQLARVTFQAEQLQGRLTSGRELLGSDEPLTISQHLFEELCRQPPDTLTLRQAVQLRLHEALAPLQDANERLRQESGALREQARAQIDAATAEAREARHAAAVAEAQAAGLREQHRIQGATEARLTARVDELLRQARARVAVAPALLSD